MHAENHQHIENKQDTDCAVFVPDELGPDRFPAGKSLQINGIFGAGRGNRTPMELLPTDFESVAVSFGNRTQ